MSETDAATAGSTAAITNQKEAIGKSSAAAKKPRIKPAHPKTSDMVNSAIKDLKERGGSSLQAIKKYISANYKVDPEKVAPFIRKYLKSAVKSGIIVQTKGKGASGSFKMALAKLGEKVAKPVKKPTKPKISPKPKVKAAKPSASKGTPKKSAVKKSPAKTKKAESKSKTSKEKTAAKSPTKKPKAPKPKKVMASKSKSPKKGSTK